MKMNRRPNNFKPGDVVQLKSGGPEMTVDRQYEDVNFRNVVECTWFAEAAFGIAGYDEGKHYGAALQDNFTPEGLEYVEPENDDEVVSDEDLDDYGNLKDCPDDEPAEKYDVGCQGSGVAQTATPGPGPGPYGYCSDPCNVGGSSIIDQAEQPGCCFTTGDGGYFNQPVGGKLDLDTKAPHSANLHELTNRLFLDLLLGTPQVRTVDLGCGIVATYYPPGL
jgi:uncharacterized protein YodC (DUF2158 family)